MKTTGNTILITGGGSGIGRALARRFHALGNEVIVAGRRAEPLAETIAGRDGMHAMVLDVEDARAIADFVPRLLARHPGLNVLVNNAGIMRSEDLTAPRDLSDAERTVETNLLAPIRLTDALIGALTARTDAAIVMVSSGLAFVPKPGTPTYNATKAAIHSYTISLREQLRDRVEVIELAPPGVQTELTPGQSLRAGYMPLEAYIDETMVLFQQVPTPEEILVERVKPLRRAERDGTFAQILAVLKNL